MSIVIENADNIHVGDSVHVTVENAPRGKNFITRAIYTTNINNQVPYEAGYYVQRFETKHSDDVEFIVEHDGLLMVWLDDDANMVDGVVSIAGTTINP